MHCLTHHAEIGYKIDCRYSGNKNQEPRQKIKDKRQKTKDQRTRTKVRGTPNAERGTQNTEHGTRNTEHGTLNNSVTKTVLLRLYNQYGES